MLGYAMMVVGFIVFVIGIVLGIGFVRQNWEISDQDFEQKIKTSDIASTIRTGSDVKRLEIAKRLGISQKQKDSDFAGAQVDNVGYYDKTEEIID